MLAFAIWLPYYCVCQLTHEGAAMTRGASQAVKDATAYLKANPSTPATTLAIKFGLNISTIYRSAWWKQYKEVAK